MFGAHSEHRPSPVQRRNSGFCLRVPAFWASWADCLPMMFERHPAVATQLINQLEGHPRTPNLGAASDAVQALGGLRGFELPSWRGLAGGAGPVEFDPDNFELGQTRASWQHAVASRIDAAFRDSLFSRMTDSAVAAIRSQGGSGAGLVLTCCPTCRVTKMEALFRVTLLWRLQLPLPLTARTCRVASFSTLWATTKQRARGGSGQARVGSGECCSTDLPRRWRSSDNQRVVAGPRSGLCWFRGRRQTT